MTADEPMSTPDSGLREGCSAHPDGCGWCLEHDCASTACSHEHDTTASLCPHGCEYFSPRNQCPTCRQGASR